MTDNAHSAPVVFSNDPEPLPKFAIVSSALLVLCVAALCCLLSACAYVPTAKPTPANQPQGTPELAQATATREPESTATPAADMVATQIALVHELATSQAETGELRDQLAAQNIQGQQMELDKQQSIENTAKYNASLAASAERTSLTDAQKAKDEEDKKALEIKEKELELARIQAIADAEKAKAGQILMVCVIAVLAIGAIALLRLASIRVEQAQQAAPPKGTAFYQDKPLEGAWPKAHIRVVPSGVSEATLIAFASHVAMSDWPGGIPFTRAEWVDRGRMKRAEWNALLFYLSQNGYARPLNPDVTNSPYVFTPGGEEYLRRFRDEATSPTVAALYPN